MAATPNPNKNVLRILNGFCMGRMVLAAGKQATNADTDPTNKTTTGEGFIFAIREGLNPSAAGISDLQNDLKSLGCAVAFDEKKRAFTIELPTDKVKLENLRKFATSMQLEMALEDSKEKSKPKF